MKWAKLLRVIYEKGLSFLPGLPPNHKFSSFMGPLFSHNLSATLEVGHHLKISWVNAGNGPFFPVKVFHIDLMKFLPVAFKNSKFLFTASTTPVHH